MKRNSVKWLFFCIHVNAPIPHITGCGDLILSIISGYDEKDGLMVNTAHKAGALGAGHGSSGKMRLAVEGSLSAKESATSFAAELKKDFDTADFEPEHLGIFPMIMQILCCAELSGNISRYDGIKFGYRAQGYWGWKELCAKSRAEAFGQEVKLAALVGTMVLSHGNYEKYYDKAMRIRRRIKASMDFDKYDAVVLSSPELARLCGLPAITFGTMTITGSAGSEAILKEITDKIGR